MPEIRGLAAAAFPVEGILLDIGIPEDLDRAQTELRDRRVRRRGWGGCGYGWYHERVLHSGNLPNLSTLRTVFLDRDGVLNEKLPEGEYVRRWDEFRLLPGVPEAIARLNRAGLRVIVVSNQRGIARKLYTAEDVEDIHLRLQELLRRQGAHIDAYYICPHDRGECNCRKPQPGLFEQAARKFTDIVAAASVMIGDSRSDMEFGAKLGMQTILIEGDPERQAPGIETARALAGSRFGSLAEAVDVLLTIPSDLT